MPVCSFDEDEISKLCVENDKNQAPTHKHAQTRTRTRAQKHARMCAHAHTYSVGKDKNRACAARTRCYARRTIASRRRVWSHCGVCCVQHSQPPGMRLRKLIQAHACHAHVAAKQAQYPEYPEYPEYRESLRTLSTLRTLTR